MMSGLRTQGNEDSSEQLQKMRQSIIRSTNSVQRRDSGTILYPVRGTMLDSVKNR